MAPVAWILRDKLQRQIVADHEVARQALRFIVRDTSQPAATRRRAQLALNSYPAVTRRTAVKDKCVEHGRSQVSRCGATLSPASDLSRRRHGDSGHTRAVLPLTTSRYHLLDILASMFLWLDLAGFLDRIFGPYSHFLFHPLTPLFFPGRGNGL